MHYLQRIESLIGLTSEESTRQTLRFVWCGRFKDATCCSYARVNLSLKSYLSDPEMKIYIISILLLTINCTSRSLRSQKWVQRHCTRDCTLTSFALHAITKSKQPGSNLPDLSQSRFPNIPENGYDLIIIGSGPAGEAAAVRASQLGAKVAVVEKK
jgi:transcriptional regulator of met regulon